MCWIDLCQLTFWQHDELLCGVLEDEVRVGQAGEEHGEGELVAVPLAVELLRVLEQVDEGVDGLGVVVAVGHHRVGLHLAEIAVPGKEEE